jgi:uroporphyrinogen-III decarboxylase
MVQELWAIDSFYQDYQEKANNIRREIMELGFPMMRGAGGGLVPFDAYSDFLRGTILTMEDFFERPEDIERYIGGAIEQTEEMILSTKGVDEGKHIFIPLHKGMDGFMSGELYRKYYWSHLQRIILAIIESGKVPYIYTEGKYNTRIDCLTEVPPGKVLYHFEDVDMAAAKKKLGGVACISGGFPAALLDWGSTEQVRDEVKRILDICAPGGGFIFETSCGLGNCKRENVEVMFETVKEYGVY